MASIVEMLLCQYPELTYILLLISSVNKINFTLPRLYGLKVCIPVWQIGYGFLYIRGIRGLLCLLSYEIMLLNSYPYISGILEFGAGV